MYGLKDKHIKAINSVFSKYPQIEKTILYGSRAKGNYRNGSDIDLTLVGDDLDLTTLLKIETELDDLLLPYKMDLSILHKIENQDLVDHINRVGITFYLSAVVQADEKMVSEWKNDKLGNVLEIKYGKDHKKLPDGKIPCYGSGGIMRYVTEQLYDKESILIPRKGSLNNIYYINEPFWTVDTLFWSKINTEIVFPKFLFYQLTEIDFTRLNVGSAVPSLTVQVLNELKINLPELPEQKQIAEILTSLDDKIDLLHRQNKTLEAMADTLFREWFVARAEEDWEEKPLSEVTDIGIGRTPPRKEFHWFTKDDKDVKWVSIKDLGESGIFVFDTSEYLTQDAVEKFNIPIIPTETVILSFKMTLGRVAITTEKMLSNEAIAHFKFNSETPFCKEYLYFYLKTYPYQILGSTSSIVTSINSGMIKNLIIRIPNKELMKEFDKASSDYFGKIKSNQIQIQTLENLRDTLLPKLMSGEIKMNIN